FGMGRRGGGGGVEQPRRKGGFRVGRPSRGPAVRVAAGRLESVVIDAVGHGGALRNVWVDFCGERAKVDMVLFLKSKLSGPAGCGGVFFFYKKTPPQGPGVFPFLGGGNSQTCWWVFFLFFFFFFYPPCLFFSLSFNTPPPPP